MTPRDKVLARIAEIGIVPVIRAESSSQALLAVEALLAGGIPIAEITMTVPCALDAIRECRRVHGARVLTGAGTVLNVQMARQCIDAGAEFLVSPGFAPEALKFAKQHDLIFIPGVLTPTEIMAARNQGADIIKVFPCGNVGGPAYVKALKGPFPDIKIIPTGGVNLTNAADYLKAGAFALGVGSELVDPAALRNSDRQRITELARLFVELVKSAKPATMRARR
jgi:2-dehydro-3-deoxyphosphogluconate aldolase/(4S)-4-hydroxy-2-oxoglutarate aldolase